MPTGIDNKGPNKNLFFCSQKTRKVAMQKDRRPFEKNHYTLVNVTGEKKCFFTLTHTSQGEVGSLDFHHHWAATGFPNPHIGKAGRRSGMPRSQAVKVPAPMLSRETM